MTRWKNRLRTFVLSVCIFFVGGCSTFVTKLTPEQGIVMLKMDIVVDGNETASFSNYCTVNFADETGAIYVLDRQALGEGYQVVRARAGKVYITGIRCNMYRVLYTKEVYFPLEGMYLEAKPGVVNYVGDLFVDWQTGTTDRLQVPLSETRYVGKWGDVLMKYSYDEASAREYVEHKFKVSEKNIGFVKADMADHELIVK